jgi:hypothetical protein
MDMADSDPDIKNDCEYTVGDDDVSLAVTIGNGNDGVTTVFLGGDEIDPVPGRSDQWVLGAGGDLKDRTLEIDAIVNPVTSKNIVVTAAFSGGPARKRCAATGTAASDDPVGVQLLIDFV